MAYNPELEIELWQEKADLGNDVGPLMVLYSYDHTPPRLDMKSWSLGQGKAEKFYRFPRLNIEKVDNLIIALEKIRKKMYELNLKGEEDESAYAPPVEPAQKFSQTLDGVDKLPF